VSMWLVKCRYICRYYTFDVAILNFSLLLIICFLKELAYRHSYKMVKWFSENNWTQSVMVTVYKTSWGDMISDISQGTVLGPILFLVSINDLPSLLQSDAFFVCKWC